MNDNLIQAITDYATTLEQRMAALEARVAQLEEANAAIKQESEDAKALVVALQKQLAELAATPQPAAEQNDPEIEVELILEDDELALDLDNDDVESELLAETVEQQEEVEEEMMEMPLETTLELEVEEEVVEEPIITPQPVQPVSQYTPQPASQPMQTSLFGAAVEDIRKAISLGDRFLFQRELFGGNGELMQVTLDDLNSCASYDEAMAYLQENFEWDMECTAAKLFENVLKRRFGN